MGMAIERGDVGHVPDFRNRGIQTAAIQAIFAQIVIHVGQIAFGRFIMAAVDHGPHVAMLHVTQIFHGPRDDVAGSVPVMIPVMVAIAILGKNGNGSG